MNEKLIRPKLDRQFVVLHRIDFHPEYSASLFALKKESLNE